MEIKKGTRERRVTEAEGFLALAVAILDNSVEISEDAFRILEGKQEMKQGKQYLKKYFDVREGNNKIMLQFDKEKARILIDFIDKMDIRFEMTLFDRMGYTDVEAEQISDTLYELGEEIRKVL